MTPAPLDSLVFARIAERSSRSCQTATAASYAKMYGDRPVLDIHMAELLDQQRAIANLLGFDLVQRQPAQPVSEAA